MFAKLSRRLEKLRRKARDNADSEDVHQIRTTLRKTRAALSLFNPLIVVPKALTDKRLADVARRFGKKRDNDVLIEKFSEISVAVGNELKPVKQVRREFDKQNKKVSKQIVKALESKSFKHILEQLDKWIAYPKFRGESDEIAAERLPELLQPAMEVVKSHAAWQILEELDLAHDLESLLEAEPGDTIHDLRKSAKMLRYQLEFAANVPGRSYVKILGPLEDLQDHLGVVQDMRVLNTFLHTSLGDSWTDELPALRQNLLATIGANIFEAKRLGSQIRRML